MVKLYLNKINNKELNPVTGLPWRIEDVPTMWRAEVQEALDAVEAISSQE